MTNQLREGLYERICESCITYVLSTLIFIEFLIIKDFHSYKTYKKVLILINSSTKTLIWNLFFDDYKIFGNLSKVREILL